MSATMGTMQKRYQTDAEILDAKVMAVPAEDKLLAFLDRQP